ncbi:MAG: histidine kinase [Bacillota bacterium]|nr:histidine kinase [Bacillota bacterium]
MDHTGHTKLSNRFVYAFSLVFAILLLITITIFYFYITYSGMQIVILNQKEQTDQAIKRVEAYLSEIDDKSYQVMTDSRIINIFSKISGDISPENYFDSDVLSKIDTASVLTSINGPSLPIWRISVYNQYGDFINSGGVVDPAYVKNVLLTSNIGEEMVQLQYTPNKIEIIRPHTDRWSNLYNSKYLTVKRPLMNIYSKEVLGIVEVQQSVRSLYDNLSFGEGNNIQVKVFDASGNQILERNILDHQKIYTTTAVSKKYGWKVELGQSRASMLAPYNPIIFMVCLGALLILILVVFITLLISRRISRPLVTLTETVKRININSMPQDLPVSENIDEVIDLKQSFSNMLTRINNSLSYERRAWLLALQSQMNPHFLYNMLSVISAAALENGDDRVVKMCSRMSSMFRYVANYEETNVTLQAELQHVKNYLALMKERYEDYFQFEITVDEAVQHMMLPKLVLQPLVENCFMHGFKNVEPPYEIHINAYVQQQLWVIEIADNGSGISDEKKKDITEKISQYQSRLPQDFSNMKIGGMGMISAILRFQLQVSGYIDYSIENNTPRGTIISIRGEMHHD